MRPMIVVLSHKGTTVGSRFMVGGSKDRVEKQRFAL
jgi:hypothetical protein